MQSTIPSISQQHDFFIKPSLQTCIAIIKPGPKSLINLSKKQRWWRHLHDGNLNSSWVLFYLPLPYSDRGISSFPRCSTHRIHLICWGGMPYWSCIFCLTTWMCGWLYSQMDGLTRQGCYLIHDLFIKKSVSEVIGADKSSGFFLESEYQVNGCL